MTLDILTPITRGGVVELGNKVYRKQVLPLGSINYEGRTLSFDEQYLTDVADSFRQLAFDTVPFVLADKDNSHTMAAERGKFGEVLGMEVDLNAVDPETGQPAPGLYSTVRLSADAEEIVQANKRFGVSVRVKEDYDRADGRHFRRACQHVLGTWDPKVTGLAPWAAVELSNTDPGAVVLDLSGLTYTKRGADMPDQKTAPKPETQEAGTKPPAWFLEWLAAGAPVPNAVETDDAETEAEDAEGEQDGDAEGDDAEDDGEGETDQVDDQGEDDETDEKFLAAIEGLFPDEADTDADQLVTASQDASGGDVELANAARDERLAAIELSNRELRTKLDAAEYEKEKAQLVRLSGLPPAVLDLARPLLEGTGRNVDLSNGTKADAGDIVRKLLTAVGKHVRLLDLSSEVGEGPELDDAEAADKHRKARAGVFLAETGLG